jgi:hypothetical protein
MLVKCLILQGRVFFISVSSQVCRCFCGNPIAGGQLFMPEFSGRLDDISANRRDGTYQKVVYRTTKKERQTI